MRATLKDHRTPKPSSSLNGELFVVTKGEGAPIRVYRVRVRRGRLPRALAARRIADRHWPAQERTCDRRCRFADRQMGCLTHQRPGAFLPRLGALTGHPGKALAYDLRQLREPQGEGIAWARRSDALSRPARHPAAGHSAAFPVRCLSKGPRRDLISDFPFGLRTRSPPWPRSLTSPRRFPTRSRSPLPSACARARSTKSKDRTT